jgi:hypothetical protein
LFEFVFRWGWIDPNLFWLTHATRGSLPPTWVSLASLLVDDSTMRTDLHGLTAVTMLRRHELDAAVAVRMVVT